MEEKIKGLEAENAELKEWKTAWLNSIPPYSTNLNAFHYREIRYREEIAALKKLVPEKDWPVCVN